MRLYIAEKPSMGREIAKCLQGPSRNGNGFIETKDGIVTWLFGHVLQQAEPQEYDPKYKQWRAEDLPIVPQKWKLLVSDSCAQQFNIVKALINKADEIVHAGDPDREGQLLVDEVLDFVGNKKPVKRILLNALDEKSIKDANSRLRKNEEFINLKSPPTLLVIPRCLAGALVQKQLHRKGRKPWIFLDSEGNPTTDHRHRHGGSGSGGIAIFLVIQTHNRCSRCQNLRLYDTTCCGTSSAVRGITFIPRPHRYYFSAYPRNGDTPLSRSVVSRRHDHDYTVIP